MKTFEERYTAWIDGRLNGPELEAFEKELAAYPEASADREEAHQLGALLRRYGQSPALSNPDFFNHQLMARIEAESGSRSRQPARSGAFVWPLPHLAWAGLCCLLVAFTIYKTAISPAHPREANGHREIAQASRPSPAPAHRPYEAEIIGAQSGDPDISVTPVHSVEDDMTVLWVDGLEYLPASYELR